MLHFKVGNRVRFKRSDLDRFMEENKQELPEYVPWQLQGRSGRSPRKR